jgi:hypothetical protein
MLQCVFWCAWHQAFLQCMVMVAYTRWPSYLLQAMHVWCVMCEEIGRRALFSKTSPSPLLSTTPGPMTHLGILTIEDLVGFCCNLLQSTGKWLVYHPLLASVCKSKAAEAQLLFHLLGHVIRATITQAHVLLKEVLRIYSSLHCEWCSNPCPVRVGKLMLLLGTIFLCWQFTHCCCAGSHCCCAWCIYEYDGKMLSPPLHD